MRHLVITALRRTLTVAWVVMVVVLIGLASWAQLTSVIVVTGGSMQPALPAGAAISPAGIAATDVATGDILTVRADNGVILTHRVTRILDLPEGRFFELRGDANAGPDPQLVPSRAVMGRVDTYLPWLGYPLALLSVPSGLVFILSALGTLLACMWLLEDVETGMRSTVRTRATARPHGKPA